MEMVNWFRRRRFLKGFYHTAAFTNYYDPVILRNKLTPLSISRDVALRKRDSKSLYFTSMCSIGCILTFKNDMGW